MRTHFSIIALVLCGSIITVSCTPEKKSESQTATERAFPAAIGKVFEAHGGYNTWAAMKSLQFEKGSDEHQTIELGSRRVRIDSKERVVGFDGQQVWVKPDSLTKGAKFYHSLMFYFYAMPFVLGDPGIVYEDVGERELFGNTVRGVKVSFDNGVGDSPKDNYILYYDPESYKMQALMYTVTYRTQETTDNFKLIRYSDWQPVGGILLPEKLQWYQFENDSVGEMGSEVLFSKVLLSEIPPADSIFRMPSNAGIATE